MAIQRIVKMTFESDKCDEFQTYFTEIKEQIALQEGCLEVKLLKDKDESGIFFTYSVWENQECIDAYRNTELFGQVWPKVKKWFAAKPEAWSTDLISKAEK